MSKRSSSRPSAASSRLPSSAFVRTQDAVSRATVTSGKTATRPRGRGVTLIAAEAMDAVALEGNVSIEPAATRRNVLTRGIDVNELVGKRFRIGDVECEGVELCEPCAHLESMTQPGVIKALVHRGGLNADILSDGEISIGDPVVAV